jgi:hypothetical protein
MTFSLIIAGQMIVTLIIDHFGLLGVPVKEVTLARIGGNTLDHRRRSLSFVDFDFTGMKGMQGIFS